jgi:hypothetical protein
VCVMAADGLRRLRLVALKRVRINRSHGSSNYRLQPCARQQMAGRGQ